MPGETTLVPPTPTVNQSDSPEQIAHTMENVQAIFDKVAPAPKGSPEPIPRPELEKQAIPVQQPETTPSAQPDQSEKAPAQDSEEHKVPSFISKALEVPEVKPDAPSAQTPDEDWPEELPTFKSTEESKARYKNWREKYNALKEEAKQLRSRPQVDEALNQKLSFLENQNKEMSTTLSKMGVEHHQKFQNTILRPMQQAYTSAAKIVQEAGGDPNDLAKALSLSGKAHYDALDSVLEGLPVSAREEATQEIRNYRKLEEQRKIALANAPQTAAALKKADMEEQLAQIKKAREDMDLYFDGAIKSLRDESKFELLQKSTDPDAQWWNDQADQIIANAKKLSEVGDMKKVPYAFVLAASADPLRKLWLTERALRLKEQKATREKYGAEPNLSESGGNFTNGSPQEDLKLPFKDVFLREFHRERAKGAR